MQSFFDFIVSPVGNRYNNTKDVDGKELILNTRIESFKSVNNTAIVIAVPLAYETDIKVGDTIVIHHNVFRRFYDMRGNQRNSRSYLSEDKYFCNADQIYLYKTGDEKWKSFGDRCFIKPIKNNKQFSLDKERGLIGILKYDNSSLNALKINHGDLVGYKPGGEYEFNIDGERLYCMKSNDIVIKYEYRGDEEEYNPSWDKSGGGTN